MWEKENKLNISVPPTSNIPSSSSTASSTTPIIKNYLSKTKNESARPPHLVKHKRHNESSKLKKSAAKEQQTTSSSSGKQKSTSRVKSAPSATSSAAKMRKSKSIPSLRDTDRTTIDEFEIDKVVSWMSIHDDFSDTTSVNNVEVSTMKRNEWRSKVATAASSATAKSMTTTTSSKLRGGDDEGNFSIEDGPDTDSPYEEIVSVIKEIEDDKLNKGEM